MDTFSAIFRQHLKPQSKILDLGAGQGNQAKTAADEGHHVVAIDRLESIFSHPNIEWHATDIKAWLSSSAQPAPYDAVFMRNVIQFFESAYVREFMVPRIMELTRPGAIVAIETFFRNPEPAFPKPLSSYWSIEELKSLFQGWEIIKAEQFDEPRKDLKGIMRHFYMTQLIARKRPS